MAGQPKSKQSAEPRTERTVVRWTDAEKKRLGRAREKAGFTYDSDLARALIQRGIEEILADEPETVAK